MSVDLSTAVAWLASHLTSRPLLSFLFKEIRHPKDLTGARGNTLVITVLLGALEAQPLGPKQCYYFVYLGFNFVRHNTGRPFLPHTHA